MINLSPSGASLKHTMPNIHSGSGLPGSGLGSGLGSSLQGFMDGLTKVTQMVRRHLLSIIPQSLRSTRPASTAAATNTDQRQESAAHSAAPNRWSSRCQSCLQQQRLDNLIIFIRTELFISARLMGNQLTPELINSVLYYADTVHVQRTGRSITGLAWIKRPTGPAPAGVVPNYSPIDPIADLNSLSVDELASLRTVLARYTHQLCRMADSNPGGLSGIEDAPKLGAGLFGWLGLVAARVNEVIGYDTEHRDQLEVRTAGA